MFRIDVGYSSAVYTGMMVLPALIVNFPDEFRMFRKLQLDWKFSFILPIITNVILSHSMFPFPSKIAAKKHEMPQDKKVAAKSHFLPVFMMMYMAMPIAGISTRPAKAWRANEKLSVAQLLHNIRRMSFCIKLIFTKR